MNDTTQEKILRRARRKLQETETTGLLLLQQAIAACQAHSEHIDEAAYANLLLLLKGVLRLIEDGQNLRQGKLPEPIPRIPGGSTAEGAHRARRERVWGKTCEHQSEGGLLSASRYTAACKWCR
jgi:hypothetical protein